LNLVKGLTTIDLGVPDYQTALIQHNQYVEALKACGLEVIVLELDNSYPDSTFVEDTALLTKHCAIITNPGAPSRRGEVQGIQSVISQYYSNIEFIKMPGTVDAGDILMVESHYYIGISERTNIDGANQVILILNRYGYTGSLVPLKNMLHLKSSVAYLENNNLVASGEFVNNPEFQKHNILKINDDESYAANCVWINERVIIPKGFPNSRRTIEDVGYLTVEVDVSEFRKHDGDISCLSLRF